MPHVMTVTGPIAPEELGATITHEHLLIDMTCYFPPPGDPSLDAFAEEPVTLDALHRIRVDINGVRDNVLLTDADLAIEELRAHAEEGGRAVVDVTLEDIGRDPLVLRRAAEETGLHVIAGCGHYVHLSHRAGLDDEPVESIHARLVGELTDGIGDSGVRPGIIGEIGASAQLHPTEAKVLRAAARAHVDTGVAITVHLSPNSDNAHEVLDLLEAEGADLRRVVADHLDINLTRFRGDLTAALDYQRSIAARGCFLEYDTCGNASYSPSAIGDPPFWFASDQERAIAIAQLCEDGYADRILLSQDVCHKTDLRRFGGVGYGHVMRTFRTHLRESGVPDAAIDGFLVDNPRRLLTIS